jgi:TonB-linked SusC/RagA family outer membrane protein
MFLVFLSLTGILIGLAQSRTVSGKVVSAADGEPIIGASVSVKGSSVGTITDFNGSFTINVSTSSSVLTFSYIGMKAIDLPASNGMTVRLEEDAELLEEVIVTGYGVTRKAAFTGSAQVVDTKTLQKTTDADPIRALASNVTGLQIATETGQPGGYNPVLIRGLGSINSGTQPLYVIDGVPITTGKFGMRYDEGSTISPLSSLNPNDIENITVLKDATATSIYGARAANGVIVINTKSGKSGKTKVNFRSKFGVTTTPSRGNYKMLNSADYYDFIGVMAVNSDFLTEDEKNDPETFNFFVNDPDWLGIPSVDGSDTDWYDAVTRTGYAKELNVDISGGSEKTTFFVSGGYYNEQGFVIGKDLSRYAFRFNLNNQISKYVSFGVNSALSYQTSNYGASGGYFSDPITQALMQLPVYPVKNEDGTWNMNTINGYNPVAQRSDKGDKSQAKQYKVLLSPYLKVNFLKEFTFLSKFGFDFYNAKEFGLWSMLQPQGSEMKMLGEEGNDYVALWTWTNTLNWIKSLGLNHINLMLGQEAQKATEESAYLAGSNYPTDEVITVENAATPAEVSTNIQNYALSSVFFNGEYDYNDKYYFSASIRRDGSSRVGANKRWGTFWSVGAKYRIVNESFFEPITNVVSNLTVRTSYGTSGNQDIGWYKARGLYGFGYNYINRPGSIPTQIANPDLTWEKTAKFNLGVEVGLFRKLSLDVEYYNNLTTAMLFEVPLSRASGFASTMQNVGEMRNSGVELTLNYNAISVKDIQWDLSLNFTKNKNLIEKLSTDKPIESTYTIREVGRPYYTFKMQEYAGVDSETGQMLWYKGESGTETTTKYNEAGKRYLGSADPKFYGGFGTTLRVYAFDLSVQLAYSIGGKVYNSAARYDENTNTFWNNTVYYVYDNMWRNPGDVTNVPAPVYGNITSHSSRYLMDGSYIKLQNAQLGFNLSRNICKNIGIEGVRIYVSGENLKTWALSKDFRGITPEVGADGVMWWNYPLASKFLFGLNVSL